MTDDTPLNAGKPDPVIVPEPTPEDEKWARSFIFFLKRGAQIKISEAVEQGKIWRVDWALKQKKSFRDEPAYPVNEKYCWGRASGKKQWVDLLHIAVSSNQPDMVRYLVSREMEISNDHVWRAIKKNNTGMIDVLLDCGFDINKKLSSFQIFSNAVSVAAYYDRPDVVAHLLKRGARVRSEDGHCPAVHAAVRQSRIGTLEILRDVGGLRDFNMVDDSGLSPLHMAAIPYNKNIAEMIPWLINNGADVMARDGRNGKTPLMLAVEHKHIPAVEALLKYPSWERKDEPVLLKAASESIREKYLKPAFLSAEKWELLSPARICCSTANPKQGAVLTEEFNFQSRDRQTFVHTIEKHELCGFARQDFDQISDRAAIEAAWRKLKELGGEAPHPYTLRDTRNKQPLP